MKNLLFYIFIFSTFILSDALSAPSDPILAEGLQPQISMDTKGVIRVAFGRNDSIFCATSKDGGENFSDPAFVGYIPKMHLGNTRGPQIASSANFSFITAIDKAGDIHSYQLNHARSKWQYKGLVNDLKSSAPEGLMSIAADQEDNLYAIWLDVRHEHKNNISFASSSGKANKWTKNKIIYISPDEHVCECCKPAISVEGSNVNVMFRNWINGSRDLYVMQSFDKGKNFKEAKKLGTGTWKLKGCPMDGGGVLTESNGNVHTVWQRQGDIYYCKPDDVEVRLASGRSCSLAANNKDIVAFQTGNDVKIFDLNKRKEITVGTGSFLRTIALPDGSIFCAWVQGKNILAKKLQ